MPNAVISSITVPVNVEGTLTNVTYDIKDAYARERLSQLGSAIYWMGVTTTALTDGGTTNPIVIPGKYEAVTPQSGDDPKALGWYEYDSQQEKYVLTNDESVQEGKTYYTTSITAEVGGMAQYDGTEFVWNGSAWQEMGHGNWGALAFKSSASGTYTPTGSVDVTAGTDSTDSVTGITAVGTLPTFAASGETLVYTPGTLPTAGSEKTFVTASGTPTASFTGTEATITVS